MRLALFLVVILWFGTQIAIAFSITNKLSVENMTATPDDTTPLKMNGDESEASVIIDDLDDIDGIDSIHLNDSLDFYARSGEESILDSLEVRTKIGNINRTALSSSFVTQSDRTKSIILRQQVAPQARSFFGLIIIPYIVCFFAAKGFWPFYPPMLQYQVNEMGKKLFSLSDDRLRQFCRGKFNFQESCYRPVFYKGYFVPIDAVTTDCPPLTTNSVAPTEVAPPPASSAQSWGDAPAKIAAKPKPSKTDVEVFDSNGRKTTSKPKLGALDDEKQPQPNINIEIHNVFSFGTSNNSQPQLQDSKITKPNENQPNPHILYV